MTSSFFGAQPPPAPPAPADDPGSSGRPSGRRRSYFLLLIAVVLIGGLAQTPPGQAALRAAGVAGGPGPYSELAFPAPEQLPRELVSGAEGASVAFSIRNVTGATHTYRWTVSLDSAGRSRPVAQGTTPLVDRATTVVTPKVTVACAPGPVSVTVRLDGGQRIAYRADCVPVTTGRLG
ncbi:hypothetical protein [Actinomadura macrotermitis]|uniref:Uncharacterized protein n=1 Tax=Actinomadura macrotermitis TaxID=2585200 RepID=A0A7K0BNX1_9ACTN|nr:hypothetical protein [Actinomadura macrotermitis]MQY02888.1 hypothetical protein [Actinomadura macrotermitis]